MTDGVAIAGLVIGGIGSAAGVGALLYAHIANTNAKESGKVADDSKELAEDANALARESNSIAVDARKLAEEANEFRRRGEARDTERHDVHWAGGWDPTQPGRYLLFKRGDHDARNVVATVTYDGHTVTRKRDAMTGDDRVLAFPFKNALRDYQAEYHDRQTRHDPYGMAMSVPHRIDQRVQWTTPLGTPKLEEHGGLDTFDVYWS